jgi:hypothetical protein
LYHLESRKSAPGKEAASIKPLHASVSKRNDYDNFNSRKSAQEEAGQQHSLEVVRDSWRPRSMLGYAFDHNAYLS